MEWSGGHNGIGRRVDPIEFMPFLADSPNRTESVKCTRSATRRKFDPRNSVTGCDIIAAQLICGSACYHPQRPVAEGYHAFPVNDCCVSLLDDLLFLGVDFEDQFGSDIGNPHRAFANPDESGR